MGFLQGFRVVLFFDANRFDRRELSEDPFDLLNVMPYGNTDELKRSPVGFEEVERLASNVAGSPEQNDFSHIT
jgi:hypothetical protein